jgi:hypothetical protein
MDSDRRADLLSKLDRMNDDELHAIAALVRAMHVARRWPDDPRAAREVEAIRLAAERRQVDLIPALH